MFATKRAVLATISQASTNELIAPIEPSRLCRKFYHGTDERATRMGEAAVCATLTSFPARFTSPALHLFVYLFHHAHVGVVLVRRMLPAILVIVGHALLGERFHLLHLPSELRL